MTEITEHSMFIAGGTRRRGRPKAQEPMEERVTIRMPSAEYDRLIRLSMEKGEPVTALVRQLLRIRIPREFPSAKK